MLDLQTEVNDANAQVVTRILGRLVTRGELSKAFDKVADQANWKNPISCVVEIEDDAELLLIRDAVIFFTASEPTFSPVSNGFSGNSYRVRADGYYKACGA